jgi:hypothetical protein
MLPLLMVSLVPSAPPEAPKLTFTAACLQEYRTRQPEDTTIGLNDPYRPPQLRLYMNVGGFEHSQVRWYSKVEITEATDDRGTDLRPDPKNEKSNDTKRANYGPKQGSVFPVQMDLKVSARGATKLTHLRGTFTVLGGGEPKTVTFPKLKGLVGKKLDDPIFKATGLGVEVVAEKEPNLKRLILELSGTLTALEGTDWYSTSSVIDESGAAVADAPTTYQSGSEDLP